MGNNGNTRALSSSLECDVGLGLKMKVQPTTESTSSTTETYSCRRNINMVLPPNHHVYQFASSTTGNACLAAGDGGGNSGSSFNTSTSNHLSDVYDAAGAADASVSATAVLPRTLQTSVFRSSGGDVPLSGKALFTASQWQELERQTIIYKYMMACIPVPPQLILPISHIPVSQSNSLDLRVSSGSDPEPWRCRRTDGKKWRCSRDVAPDQKYCERHAHKSKPRSRKPVELQSRNITNNYSSQPLQSQKPISRFPTMASPASYDQTRTIEWFMRGGNSGTNPVSICNQQQWQQLNQSSSRLGLNRDNSDYNKNLSASPFLLQYEGKQGSINLNPYIRTDCSSFSSCQRLEEDLHRQQQQNNGRSYSTSSSLHDPKMDSSRECLALNAAQKRQTTRHFIDAWSMAEKEGFIGDNYKNAASSSSNTKKLPFSSLSLSMSGGNGNGIDEENGNNTEICIGMMNSERDSDGVLKAQWLNPVSWINSPPGGPLGEALCLGNASTNSRGENSNLASPHCYSNTNTASTTNSSSCSKSS